MRLNADQLPAALAENVAGMYLVSGDEPLLVGEAADAIRAAARRRAMRTARCFSSIAVSPGTSCATPASRCRCLPSGVCSNCACRAASRTREPQQLAELAAAAARPTWCAWWSPTSSIKRQAMPPGYRPSRSTESGCRSGRCETAALPGWLRARAKLLKVDIEPAAAQLIVDRVEGNLLAAKQELEKLSLLADGKPISADLVLRSVGDSARYDVFQLAEAAAGGDAARALRVLLGLKSEGVEPTLILWALVRELRGLWQARERDRLRSTDRGSGWNLAATPSPRALARLKKLPLAAPAAAGRPHRPGHQGTGDGRCLERADRSHRKPRRRFASEPRNQAGYPHEPHGHFRRHLRSDSLCAFAHRVRVAAGTAAEGNPVSSRRQSAAPRSTRSPTRNCDCKWCSWRPPVRPGFVVDDREVRKAGPSYSVETLAELRHEYPDRSLCLIVGMDAFLSLPKWHQWRELLQLAHLVVAHRPGLARARHGAPGRALGRSRHRTHRRFA